MRVSGERRYDDWLIIVKIATLDGLFRESDLFTVGNLVAIYKFTIHPMRFADHYVDSSVSTQTSPFELLTQDSSWSCLPFLFASSNTLQLSHFRMASHNVKTQYNNDKLLPTTHSTKHETNDKTTWLCYCEKRCWNAIATTTRPEIQKLKTEL